MNIMFKHIYLSFGVISFMNKEMVTFIKLHTYKFGLVYVYKKYCCSRSHFSVDLTRQTACYWPNILIL